MTDKAVTLASTTTSNPSIVSAIYEETRSQLRDLLKRRRELEVALAAQETLIAKKEHEYLEETPSGNVITGFDNYTKGNIVAGRRRGRDEEERERRWRVFSRSSISWNPQTEQPEADQSAANTATTDTPTLANFQKTEVASVHVATTNATSAGKGTLTKKNKKGVEDVDGGEKDQKKARISFGPVRK
ncbi:unnamed protein product [Blumeria hordei]|uniref:Chromatin modification-related protein EAF6 n=2 Tax=Blumeria hordei TaxID=2867405 RepID=A0A383ULP6_BLUHO|nr:NuA4 histone acetyltransferase complex subunit [Blumeria hordei DH14]SZF00280.1 unnamed protein product [Blumeria hordei]